MTGIGRTAPHAEGHRPVGWRRWLYSTNHKDIGTMYLVFAVLAGLIGGVLSIAMRMELAEPGLQVFQGEGGYGDSQLYYVFMTAHGLIMIFFVVIDRKSTRLTPVTNAHLVCRLLLEKTNKP